MPHRLRSGDVTASVLRSLDAAALQRWGDRLRLIALPDGGPVGDDESLKDRHLYRFEFTVPCDLELFVYPNPLRGQRGAYELAYLEEEAPNLDPGAIKDLAAAWAVGAHSYSVDSGVSRAPGEIDLLVTIASVIAERCDGWIVVAEAGFLSCPEGAYTREQFRTVEALSR